MSAPVLNEKQAEFCRRYTSGPTAGVASASARAAGYTGNDRTLETTASRLLRRPGVIAQIVKLRAAADDVSIADAKERRLFLSRVLRGDITDTRLVRGRAIEVKATVRDRIRASDQLARMNGEYSEHLIHQVTGPQAGPVQHEVKITIEDAMELLANE